MKQLPKEQPSNIPEGNQGNPKISKQACLFVHDFRYVEHDGHVYGLGQFSYEKLWSKKYLHIFSEMTVIARGELISSRKDIPYKSILNGPNVDFVSTPNLASLNGLLSLYKAYKIIKAEVNKTDLVFIRLPSTQGLLACYIANKIGKPYIIESVSNAFDSLRYHDRLKGPLMAPILGWLNKRAIRKSENVIYVTEKYLQKVYPNNHNTLSNSDVVVAPDNKILDSRMSKINQYNANTVFKLGLVGPYDVNHKGHDLAIKTMKKLLKSGKHAELHFLGDGDSRRWHKKAIKLGVEQFVFFDSPVSTLQEMGHWYQSIDLLLVPSKSEGLPRVVIEAMSYGVPIIASEVAELPYILPAKSLHRKGDCKDMFRKVNALLSNKLDLKDCSRVGFEKSKKYSVNTLAMERDLFIRAIIGTASRKLISVVIPMYNVEKYISSTLDSVISQTHKDFSIIAVDDGSTDNTLKIVNRYMVGDSRIRVIEKNNGGVSSARNVGLNYVDTKYFTFIDADDKVDAEYISTLLHLAEINEADLVCAKLGFSRNLRLLSRFAMVSGPEQLSRSLATKRLLYDRGISNHVPSKLYRTSLLGKLRFDEGIFIGEDMEYLFRVLRKSTKIILIKDRLYQYVQRAGSAMNVEFSRKRADSYFAAKKMESHNGLTPSEKRATKAKLFTEAFSILSLVYSDRYEYQDIYMECLQTTRKLAPSIINNSEVRLRQRLYAATILISVPAAVRVATIKKRLSKFLRIRR